jgi:hypothetical protein
MTRRRYPPQAFERVVNRYIAAHNTVGKYILKLNQRGI